MPTKQIVKPNFLVFGAQKSATTWLCDVLSKHPQVFMLGGEAQFFNRDFVLLENYLSRFENSENYLIRGEKTPDYLHMSNLRIRRIKEALGLIKLAIVLRRPEERAWSQARMEESYFNQTSLSDADFPRLARNVVSYRNFDRCRYSKHLTRWIDVFGREQLFVGFYEEIVESPKEFLFRLSNWLGIDAGDFSDLPRPIWQSPEAAMPREISDYLSGIHGKESIQLRKIGITPPASWDKPLNANRRMFPLLRFQAQMIPFNCFYRLYDLVRGRIPGHYTTRVNQWYHMYYRKLSKS